jgi:phosphotransferase system HPr (HPr) family protein
MEESQWTIYEAEVKNYLGIHARPTNIIVNYCLKNGNDKEIKIQKIDPKTGQIENESDAYSTLQLLLIGAEKGSKLKVCVRGIDEEAKKICKGLQELVSSEFEEAYRI